MKKEFEEKLNQIILTMSIDKKDINFTESMINEIENLYPYGDITKSFPLADSEFRSILCSAHENTEDCKKSDQELREYKLEMLGYISGLATVACEEGREQNVSLIENIAENAGLSKLSAYMFFENKEMEWLSCESLRIILENLRRSLYGQGYLRYNPYPYPFVINGWTEEEFNNKKEELLKLTEGENADPSKIILTESMYKDILLMYPGDFYKYAELFEIDLLELPGDEGFKKLLHTAYSPYFNNLDKSTDIEKDACRGIIRYLNQKNLNAGKKMMREVVEDLGYYTTSFERFITNHENEWVSIGALREVISKLEED